MARPRPPAGEELRAHLLRRSKEDLVDLLLERAAEDEWLHGRLALAAAGSGDFRTVDAAVDEIEGLLGDHPEAVVELAEHALSALEAAHEAIDDPDGGLTIALEPLSELHLAACAACAPPSEALAERLFRMELAGEIGVFHGAAATYADVLGPAGLARYRRLAEAEWSRVPPLGPGAAGGHADRRFRVTAMMEALAWAERGLAAHPERHDSRLSDFVAEAYLRADRRDQAMAVTWDDFVARPVLERFERLRTRSGGGAGWERWRERALAHLRAQLAGRRGGGPWIRPPDASELVRALLAEDDLDAAWAEARASGCSEGLWLELAGRREADHPEDALEVYRRRVEGAVARTDRRGYEEAVGLLRRMRPLAQRIGEGDAFGREVAALREAHRRKRNLVALLDGLGWPEVPSPGA